MEKDPSDADLIAAVNAGNWEAFDQLYYRYRDWTFRLAWRFCGDENDALDVVQEVFVYLAGKFPGFELRAHLTTLLYPAVKHTALALKRKRRRLSGSIGDALDIEAPPEIAAVDQQRAELADVLKNLSDAHREVLLMRFVDDMTMEEIATALAIPLGTAKSRLHHAISAMRSDPRLRRWFDPGAI